jgi:hypothetical protein
MTGRKEKLTKQQVNETLNLLGRIEERISNWTGQKPVENPQMQKPKRGGLVNTVNAHADRIEDLARRFSEGQKVSEQQEPVVQEEKKR